MGVEFRLGGQDHKKVEDFLASRPSGVSAIVLDTKAARYQRAAAEAATEMGAAVYFDPATERLTEPGFDLSGYMYYPANPYEIDILVRDAAQRLNLVGNVIRSHPSFATLVTPPHFFVRDERSANLNVALAELARLENGPQVRATVVLSSRVPLPMAAVLAAEYVRAGIRDVELRISPFGGDDEGVRKIRKAFSILLAFTNAGLSVTLGQSGNLGQSALALGYALHYSVGVGMRERVNHLATISRQQQPPKPSSDNDDERGGGPVSGIYLPGPAITVTRRVGKVLLENTDIRTRIGCRLGQCGSSVNGPSVDPRGHYLHARANEVAMLLATPAPWRPKMEADRLVRARQLRSLINRTYRPAGVAEFKIRTLTSLTELLIRGPGQAVGTA